MVCRLCFSLGISKLVPAVPRKSLHPTHAPYTPATVRPIIRLPTDLSQRKYPPLVLVTIMNSHDASSMGLLSLIFRMRTCPRSCLRGTYPHLLRRLLRHTDVPRPDLIGSRRQKLGLLIGGMAQLAAPFADLTVLG